MRSPYLRLLKFILPAAAALTVGLAAPAQSAAAVTVASNYGTSIYIDAGSSNPIMHGAYVGYTITTTTAQSDVWATIGNFAGGTVTAAPHAATTVHVGAMAASSTTTVYFYVAATAATTSAQTHTITVYNGEPGAGGTSLTAADESITVGDTQQASANKVDSVSVSTTAPTLGGTFAITVNGHTGTMGSNAIFFLAPEADLNFPANKFQLVATSIVFAQSGCPSVSFNCGSFADTLAIPFTALPNTADTPYVATYTFRAIGTTTTTTSLSPVVYITSGNLVKHTTPTSLASLAPINPVSNTTTLGVSSSPNAVNATSRTVTLTATATSSGAAMNLDDLVATLPSGAIYVTGSAQWGASAIEDPNLSGQTLTWAGVWNVPANGANTLSFQITLPAGSGAYTTSVVGHAGGSQIDSTVSTGDDAPATVTDNVYADAPGVSFTSTPAALSNTSAPAFAFASTASGATFQCVLDGAAPVACTSPDTLTGVADGQHTLSVTATDPVGNVSAPVSDTWTVALPIPRSDPTPPSDPAPPSDPTPPSTPAPPSDPTPPSTPAPPSDPTPSEPSVPAPTTPAPGPGNVTSSGVGTNLQQHTVTLPAGGTVSLRDAGGASATTVTVAGQGTYSIDSASGVLSFMPVLGFTGVPTPVTYVIADAAGRTGAAQYAPAVGAPPAPPAAPLTSSGPLGQTQTEAVILPAGGTLSLSDATRHP